MDTKEPG